MTRLDPRNATKTKTVGTGGSASVVFDISRGAVLTAATARITGSVGASVHCQIFTGQNAGHLKDGWMRTSEDPSPSQFESVSWHGFLPLGGLPAAPEAGPTVVFEIHNDTGSAELIELRVDWVMVR